MKILSKNKIIVSALALCIGASLAGSVSGTIAWYQYSTRANVSFIGKSGGFSGNLQMRFVGETDDDWRTRITWEEMNTYLGNQGYAEKVIPMTYGALDKDDALPANAYTQPLPGVAKMQSWKKADKKNYAQFKLELRYNERDGVEEGNPAVDDKNVEKDVFLSKLLIQQDADNGQKGDISDAVRVHISASSGNSAKNRLISKQGKEMATSGKLDMDGDGDNDQAYQDENDEFGFNYVRDNSGSIIYDNSSNPTRVDLTDVVYGEDENGEVGKVQKSYKAEATDAVEGVKYTSEEIAAAQEGDPAHGKTVNDWKTEPVYPAIVYSKNNELFNDSSTVYAPDPGRAIGKTVASESNYLQVTVTIWVEGWQKFDNAETAIWKAKYIDAKFNVGIQFAVQDKI